VKTVMDFRPAQGNIAAYWWNNIRRRAVTRPLSPTHRKSPSDRQHMTCIRQEHMSGYTCRRGFSGCAK